MFRSRLSFLLLLACHTPMFAQMELPPGTRPADAPAAPAANADAAELAAAESAIEQKDYPAAIKLLQPITARSPKNARAFYDLGFAQEAGGHDGEAAIAYRAALSLNANDVRSGISLGLLLARTGDRAGAEAALRPAVSAKDGDAALQARADRALARLDLDSAPEKARDEMIAALKLSPETADDLLLTGEIAERLGDNEAAVTAYGRAAGMDPDSIQVADVYAHALLRKGDLPKAEATLIAALKRHPDEPALTSGLAAVMLKQNRAPQAIPLLMRLHEADRANLALTRLLAHAYASQENWSGANPIYAELVTATPGDPVLLADWGDVLIRQKRNAEAEAVLEKAVAEPSRFPSREALAEAAGELAFAAENNEHPETVLRAAALRNDILPPDAKTTFLSATAHDRLHHTRQASELYRQFIDLSHGSYPDQEWQAQQRISALGHAK